MRDCDEILELISARLDGELSGAEEAELQEHLRACAACRALYEDLNEIHAAMPGLNETPPPALMERVMESIRAETPETIPFPAADAPSKRKAANWRAWSGVAAVLVVALLGTTVMRFGGFNGGGSGGEAPETVMAGGGDAAPAPSSRAAVAGDAGTDAAGRGGFVEPFAGGADPAAATPAPKEEIDGAADGEAAPAESAPESSRQAAAYGSDRGQESGGEAQQNVPAVQETEPPRPSEPPAPQPRVMLTAPRPTEAPEATVAPEATPAPETGDASGAAGQVPAQFKLEPLPGEGENLTGGDVAEDGRKDGDPAALTEAEALERLYQETFAEDYPDAELVEGEELLFYALTPMAPVSEESPDGPFCAWRLASMGLSGDGRYYLLDYCQVFADTVDGDVTRSATAELFSYPVDGEQESAE